MNIRKQDFNKLSQLDRIEFRQRYEMGRISSVSIIDYAYYVLIIAVIAGVTGYMGLFATMIKVTALIVIADILFRLFRGSVNKSRINELEREYFGVITKDCATKRTKSTRKKD
jgi:hypothetical protein